MSVFFVPLFGKMEIPKIEDEEEYIFGFETYEEYEKWYFKISIFPKYRIFILEDFFQNTESSSYISLPSSSLFFKYCHFAK